MEAAAIVPVHGCWKERSLAVALLFDERGVRSLNSIWGLHTVFGHRERPGLFAFVLLGTTTAFFHPTSPAMPDLHRRKHKTKKKHGRSSSPRRVIPKPKGEARRKTHQTKKGQTRVGYNIQEAMRLLNHQDAYNSIEVGLSFSLSPYMR